MRYCRTGVGVVHVGVCAVVQEDRMTLRLVCMMEIMEVLKLIIVLIMEQTANARQKGEGRILFPFLAE